MKTFDTEPYAIRDERNRWIMAHVPTMPAMKVLDAGCGDGAMLQRLSRYNGLELYGIDIDRSRCNAPGALVRKAPVENIPFENEYFDIVFCTNVLEHTLDVYAGLKELIRVLHPNGRLVILVPLELHWWHRLIILARGYTNDPLETGNHTKFFKSQHIPKALRDCGMVVTGELYRKPDNKIFRMLPEFHTIWPDDWAGEQLTLSMKK